MPARNVIKTYIPQAYYHVYNRGVEKRDIFLDERDYKVFLSYLRVYLLPQIFQGPSSKCYPSKQLKNYASEVDLAAYVLMPNHFHFLLYQQNINSITSLMRSLITKYVKYFNTRYHRVGPLFQSRYKAIQIATSDELVYVSKYIHRNPAVTSRSVLEVSQYSSFRNYLYIINQSWVKPGRILDCYASSKPQVSYETYVEDSCDGEDVDFEDGPRSEL